MLFALPLYTQNDTIGRKQRRHQKLEPRDKLHGPEGLLASHPRLLSTGLLKGATGEYQLLELSVTNDPDFTLVQVEVTVRKVVANGISQGDRTINVMRHAAMTAEQADLNHVRASSPYRYVVRLSILMNYAGPKLTKGKAGNQEKKNRHQQGRHGVHIIHQRHTPT